MDDSGHLESGCSCETPRDSTQNGLPYTQGLNGPKILVVYDSDNIRLMISALNLKQAMDAQKRVTALVKDLLEERDLALQTAKEKV